MKSTRQQVVKTETELLEMDLGVPVTLQTINGNIEAVIVGEGENQIRITKSQDYGKDLRITRPQQAKTREVWYVKGDLLGLAAYKSDPFKVEYEAHDFLTELRNKNGLDQTKYLEVVMEEEQYFEDNIG